MPLSNEWAVGMASQAYQIGSDADMMGSAGMGEMGTQTFGARGNLRETFGNLYEISYMLKNMGIINQEVVDVTQKISAIVIMGTSFYMLYAGVKGLVGMLTSIHLAAASAETAATAATGPVGWITIGIAMAAAAAVPAAFAIGYYIGQDQGEDNDVNVTYTNVSLNSPNGMSRAENGMREASVYG